MKVINIMLNIKKIIKFYYNKTKFLILLINFTHKFLNKTKKILII